MLAILRAWLRQPFYIVASDIAGFVLTVLILVALVYCFLRNS